MNTNVEISGIFPNIVRLNVELKLRRLPQTGLARLPQCQSGIWVGGSKTLESKTWSMASGSNYGDICSSYLVNSGLINLGWIVTGSDACTEDSRDCTVDNVKCFAVRLK
ncbi:hypothetical protein MIL71_004164 [Salmonella enterica subsp. enterica serovar Reading]|nr:hypothetical protein [Salmonella enterica subsp. enterica serovar Reading]